MEEKVILENYLINQSTEALQHAYHTDYFTKVLEVDKTIYVKKLCTTILEESCLPGGSNYDGRRAAVIHELGRIRKAPIIVSSHLELYAIPTRSPKDYSTTWIIYHQISNFTADISRPGKCIVIFKSGHQLPLDVSLNVMLKQLYRTAQCVNVFSRRKA